MNFISTFDELNKLYEEMPAAKKEDEKLEDTIEEACAKEELTEAAEDEEIEIVDDEAPVEEPVEEDEPRQVICECDKCGALVIKDEADIVVDEETDLVNVEEECQFCEEAKGYKIIGVVAPYEAAEAEEPVEDELAEEDDVIDEGLNEGADIKDPTVSKILARLKKIADANGTKIGADNMSSQTELIKKHCSEKECDLLRNVELTDGSVVNMLEEDLADVARKVFDKPASIRTQQSWEDRMVDIDNELVYGNPTDAKKDKLEKEYKHLEKKFAQQRDWEERHPDKEVK